MQRLSGDKDEAVEGDEGPRPIRPQHPPTILMRLFLVIPRPQRVEITRLGGVPRLFGVHDGPTRVLHRRPGPGLIGRELRKGPHVLVRPRIPSSHHLAVARIQMLMIRRLGVESLSQLLQSIRRLIQFIRRRVDALFQGGDLVDARDLLHGLLQLLPVGGGGGTAVVVVAVVVVVWCVAMVVVIVLVVGRDSQGRR